MMMMIVMMMMMMNTMVRKVYDSPMVMRFLAKASGKQRMFQMDDEFQCINIMCR